MSLYRLSMKSKGVTICFFKWHLQEGLLNNVSTKGNWFEAIPNQYTPEGNFMQVALSLSNRSMKGHLGLP